MVLRLVDDVDVGRGDLLVCADDQPRPSRAFEATVCWLGEEPLASRRYALKHTTRTTRALIEATDVLDVGDGARWSPRGRLALNDIGRIRVRTSDPLAMDDYVVNRRTGAFLLLDEASGATVAAGMAGPLPWSPAR